MSEKSRQHHLVVAHELSDSIKCLRWDYVTRFNGADDRTQYYIGEMVRQLDQVKTMAEWIVAMLEQESEHN